MPESRIYFSLKDAHLYIMHCILKKYVFTNDKLHKMLWDANVLHVVSDV